jgi:hypothetical protein
MWPKIKTVSGLLIAIYIIMAFVLASFVYAGESRGGSWSGPFPMGDNFIVVIELAEDYNSGRVKMYANSNNIQDDALSDIRIVDTDISFFIPDKQTSFKGFLENDRLKGTFIFPDQSEHVVLLERDSPDAAVKVPETAQDGNGLDYVYNEKELAEDIDTLFNAVFAKHPNPFLFEHKAWFDSTLQLVYDALAPCNEVTFFNTLSPLIARIGCAHTGIRLSPQSESELKARTCFLPLHVHISKNQAYVLDSFDSQAIQGWHLISINGRELSDIVSTMQRFIPADGYNASAIEWQMAQNFNWFYALYVEMPDHFTVELFNPQGKIIKQELSAVPFERLEQFSNQPQRTELPDFSIHEKKSYALLSMPHFAYPDFHRYHLFLKENFQRLKESSVNALLIDLRGNQGGHPLFAAELFSFVLDEKFVYFSATDIPEFDLLTTPLPPKDENFTGQVFLLVDGGCLSTTGHFLSLVKHYNVGALVGSTPGSSFYCHDNSFQLLLPHSGIRANIPQSIFQTAVHEFKIGEPLKVDYLIEPDIKSILQNKDVVLEKAIMLIR